MPLPSTPHSVILPVRYMSNLPVLVRLPLVCLFYWLGLALFELVMVPCEDFRFDTVLIWAYHAYNWVMSRSADLDLEGRLWKRVEVDWETESLNPVYSPPPSDPSLS